MKFIQAFEKIKEKIGNPDLSGIADSALEVTLTNKDSGGTFYIQVKDGALHIEPYDYHDNNAAIITMYGELNKILDGRLDPIKAVEKGSLTVSGDSGWLLTFFQALQK